MSRYESKRFYQKKYGTVGLLEAIGNRKTGQIARGNDWANVSELLELLR